MAAAGGGADGHETGGMNDGNGAAPTATDAAGSGVLIAVRFAKADMSAHKTIRDARQQVPPPGDSQYKYAFKSLCQQKVIHTTYTSKAKMRGNKQENSAAVA